jgi:hypothetical protein
MLRLACFTAVIEKGYKPSDTKLTEISTDTYFADLSFKRESEPVQKITKYLTERNCALKPKYKIAYLFMVHDGLQELKNLYQLLHDDNVFFYFHVDVKRPNMLQQVSEWLKSDVTTSQRCNHAIMPNSVNILWGHSSMIMAQIEAFFQLYHLIHFEFIINLSVDHYPIRSTKAIYKTLQKYKDSSLFVLPG